MTARHPQHSLSRVIASGEPITDWRLGRLQFRPSHVPANWELVPIVTVARLESGHTPSRKRPEYWNGDIPWVSLHDTKHLDVRELYETQQMITQLGLDNSSARLLPRGTVVFSRTATVGKCTVIGREMATSQDFANYVCGPKLHNHYLVQLFRYLEPEWQRLMAGSTHSTVYMPVFEQLQVLLPPIEEQRKIAAILSSIDEVIETTEGVIEHLQIVKKAMMQELLTRGLPGHHARFKKTEVGKIPTTWQCTSLGQVLEGIDSGWSPQCESDPAGPHEWGVLKISSVTWGEFKSSENKRLPLHLQPRPEIEVHAGDVIVSRANTPELVGRAVLVRRTRPKLMLSDKLLRLRVVKNAIDARFLNLVLALPRSREFIKAGATGTSLSMKNISQSKLRELPLALPSLEEQATISDAIEALSLSEQREEDSIAALRTLKSALMLYKPRISPTVRISGLGVKQPWAAAR